MKKILFTGLLAAFFALHACKHDHDDTSVPAYQIEIESPNTDDKSVGETLDIHVHFSEKNGGKVHNINVRIFEKDSGTEIYNKPDEAHAHADGEYIFEDTLPLTTAGHWVLEAKVWGHDDGVAEVVKSVEFHVN